MLPAIVMIAEASFLIGVLEGVVRVLESFTPKQAGFSSLVRRSILAASIVGTIGSVALGVQLCPSEGDYASESHVKGERLCPGRHS